MAARLTAYLVVAIVAGTLVAGLIVGAQRDDNEGPVDLIVQNAAVFTADRRGTLAEAVAVRGNQILRVGSNREIARLQRRQTVVVDARGGTVLPGFNDAHLRLDGGGLPLSSVDLTGASTVSDILSRVAAWSRANPGSSWIVGRGWASEEFRGATPWRQVLDSVAPDRPVLLAGRDESTVSANSAALQHAGITRATPDPPHGTIVRDSRTGEPTGLLRGAAGELAVSRVPKPSPREDAKALRAAISAANAAGITSVQNTAGSTDAFELYDGLRRSGDLTLRIYSAISVPHPITEDQLARLDETRIKYADDPLFKAGALSIRLDGPLSGRSAASLEPLLHPTDSGNTTTRPNFSADELNRTVRLADAAGWQIMTHATGDQAARMALNAYAHAIRSNRPPDRGRRHRIENLTIIDAADIARFGPLGVVASMQPSRAVPMLRRSDLFTRDPGAVRAARRFPFRSVAEETRLVFGSGWPAYDWNPLLGIHIAVNRTSPAGPLASDPSETVELKEAIEAYTSRAAWASFDEQRKGSLSPGMLADLVVLSDDIFATPPERLASVSVMFTIFDGQIVYRHSLRSGTD